MIYCEFGLMTLLKTDFFATGLDTEIQMSYALQAHLCKFYCTQIITQNMTGNGNNIQNFTKDK